MLVDYRPRGTESTGHHVKVSRRDVVLADETHRLGRKVAVVLVVGRLFDHVMILALGHDTPQALSHYVILFFMLLVSNCPPGPLRIA